MLSASSGIVHPYYVSALGPGVAAMTAVGATSFARLVSRGRRYLILPAAALATTVAVALVLLTNEYNYLHWLWPVLAAVAATAIVIMAWRPAVAAPAVAAALCVALAVPAVYSATVWEVPVNGPFRSRAPISTTIARRSASRSMRWRSTAGWFATCVRATQAAAGIC